MKSYPTKKLGELISFEKGKKMTTAIAGEPYIGIDGLRTNQYSVYTKEKNGIRCKSDDVLLVWDGAHAGTVGTGLNGFVGSTIVKVLNDNSLDNKFLFYLLKFSQEKIRAAAQGAAIPHLNKAFINSIQILLSPPTIQKQIVERLDKIAEAQKLNHNLIQKSDELFQSLLHQELNPAGKDWEIKELGILCDVRDGTHASPKFFPDGLPLVTSKNLIGGVIDFSNIQFIAEKDYLEIEKRSKVDDGDILFGMIGTIGNPVIVHKNRKFSIKNVGLIKFTATSPINSFVYYTVLSSFVGQQIKKFSRGGTQKFVSLGNLRNLKIYLPDKKIQKQIVAKLSAVQDYKTQLLAQKSKLKELFDSALSKSFQHS